MALQDYLRSSGFEIATAQDMVAIGIVTGTSKNLIMVVLWEKLKWKF